MMLKLQRYNLHAIYKRGKELYVADTLSRAYLLCTDSNETVEDYDVMTVEVLSSRRQEELRRETLTDPRCRHLSEVIASGWPDSSKKLSHDLRPFYSMRDELTMDNGLLFRDQRFVIPHSLQQLTMDNGLLFRGQRFVIPHSLQHYYVKQLHQGHPGLEATKRRTRETMFWPTIYQDIENEVAKCAPCNALQPHQTKEPLRLHDIPDLPWAFTAADVFEWGGKEHLVLVLAGTKWTSSPIQQVQPSSPG
ncbi:hypothetical protein ACEWY4_008454 [Coilia grayii]|uniref:Gypsy retrotransposon integrase-like protein 1 n=1 Tax=Coilia grayii TaxID=363190 RepID=A0ABD1KB63_9TELE